MYRPPSDTFVCEFGLHPDRHQARELAIRREAARQVYDAALQRAPRRVSLTCQSRIRQQAQHDLYSAYLHGSWTLGAS